MELEAAIETAKQSAWRYEQTAYVVDETRIDWGFQVYCWPLHQVVELGYPVVATVTPDGTLTIASEYSALTLA